MGTTVKEQLTTILSEVSASFKALQGITEWNLATLFANIGLIVQAIKDAVKAIEAVQGIGKTILEDNAAQEQIAEILDDAVQLNAVLEGFDGPIFKILVKELCQTIKAKAL